MKQLRDSTDLDTITAYLSSPVGSMELDEHLERRANAYTLIAALLVEYPFKTYDELQNMVTHAYPELTKGTLYTYIRDTKAIYGNLDKVDRGFERVIIKAQIGKAIEKCYKMDDMRPVPKLLELYMKLYRLDKPDVFTESAEEMQKKIVNQFFVQYNEVRIDENKTVNLDDFIEKFELELKNEQHTN